MNVTHHANSKKDPVVLDPATGIHGVPCIEALMNTVFTATHDQDQVEQWGTRKREWQWKHFIDKYRTDPLPADKQSMFYAGVHQGPLAWNEPLYPEMG